MDRGAWQIQYVESQRVRHDKVTEHYEDDICHCVVSYISYEFFVHQLLSGFTTQPLSQGCQINIYNPRFQKEKRELK